MPSVFISELVYFMLVGKRDLPQTNGRRGSTVVTIGDGICSAGINDRELRSNAFMVMVSAA